MKGFLERLQWKLSGMMQGRRGADTFSNFLVVAGIVLLFASLIPGLDLLSWVALIVLAVLTKQGKTGKLLPETAERLPVYISCGLSAVALLAALAIPGAAYYAIWAMAAVIFALAVYYTVKQL